MINTSSQTKSFMGLLAYADVKFNIGLFFFVACHEIFKIPQFAECYNFLSFRRKHTTPVSY